MSLKLCLKDPYQNESSKLPELDLQPTTSGLTQKPPKRAAAVRSKQLDYEEESIEDTLSTSASLLSLNDTQLAQINHNVEELKVTLSRYINIVLENKNKASINHLILVLKKAGSLLV